MDYLYNLMRSYLFIIFILVSVLFTNCDKDHELVKDIAGTWQVSRITYQLDSGDSVVNNQPIATFTLMKCKWKKEPDNQCGGSYQFVGQNTIYLGYNAVQNGKLLTFYIHDMPEQRDYPNKEAFLQAQEDFWGGNQPYLGDGNWIIVESSDNRLVIEGTATLSRFGEALSKQARTRIEMIK